MQNISDTATVCGQSPNNIKSLLKYGYPANKISGVAGGMQNWENLCF